MLAAIGCFDISITAVRMDRKKRTLRHQPDADSHGHLRRKAVRKFLAAWRPKMKNGGMCELCCSCPMVRSAFFSSLQPEGWVSSGSM